MRRTTAFLLMIGLLASVMTGCRPNVRVDGEASGDKISVVATIFAPYDFTRAIAGGLADVTMLLAPGAESHAYEPSIQDINKIRNSRVFIYVGGESDTWVEGMLASMDTDKMKLVTLMDCVRAVEEEIVEGMEETAHEPEEASYDEHVWTCPENAKQIVQKICAALCEADEANAPVYKQNADAYAEQLDKLDAAFHDVTQNAVRRTIVFGDRFPFRYLADAYGLDYFAAFPGCSAESEPSAATVAFLIDKIRGEHIPVVFHAELSSTKMAETISEATGAKVRLLHACHNIAKEDFDSGVGYLELMSRNADALKEALT